MLNPATHNERRNFILGVIAALLLGIFFTFLAENIHVLGHNIPTTDIGSDYFRGFFWAAVLVPAILLIPCRPGEQVSLLVLWGLRCSVTLGFMLYYEYNYGLDAYQYFANAVSPTEFLMDTDIFNGTAMVTALSRTLAQNVPFLASYHALKVFWSFFGFLGSYLFYRAYSNATGHSNIKILWLINCFPSILFWSSILGKDPITFFGISLFFYGSLELIKRFSFIHLISALLGLAIAGSIRIWLVVIFLIPFLLIVLLRSRMQKFGKLIIVASLGTLLFYFSTDIMNNLQVSEADGALKTISTVSSSWTHGGSGQEVQSFESARDLLVFLPKGIFAALYRPLPGEVGNFFGLLSGFENLFLLFFLVYGLMHTNREQWSDPFVQYGIITVFIWSIFYSFISYQNLGTAVRFKLQILPLLILIPFHLMNKPDETTALINENNVATKS